MQVNRELDDRALVLLCEHISLFSDDFFFKCFACYFYINSEM